MYMSWLATAPLRSATELLSVSGDRVLTEYVGLVTARDAQHTHTRARAHHAVV